MDIDTDRIDEAVLALLWLGLHDGLRAWKTFDWDAMDRLHAKGLIHDPVGKACQATREWAPFGDTCDSPSGSMSLDRRGRRCASNAWKAHVH